LLKYGDLIVLCTRLQLVKLQKHVKHVNKSVKKFVYPIVGRALLDFYGPYVDQVPQGIIV
jgi:hypothetical protein